MGIRERMTGRQTTTETLALGVGAAAFIVVCVAALFTFGFANERIDGPGSLGRFTAIASAVVALPAFAAGWCLPPHRRLLERTVVMEVLDAAVIGLAHTMIALLLWISLARVVEDSFRGALVYSLPAVAIAGVTAAVTGYYSFLSAQGMTALRLSGVLAVFLVLGGITSMMLSPDPLWWQRNLSALGRFATLSAITFDVTVVIAGLLVMIISRYATEVLETGRRRAGVTALRWVLFVLGAQLVCVGLFPVDHFYVFHTIVATSMVGVFFVVAAGMRWFAPELPLTFVVLGLVFLALIMLSSVFFWVGYYNLTAVELIAAVLLFGWIIVFLRTVSATAGDRRTMDAESSDPAQ